MLQTFLKSFLWDVDFQSVDSATHAHFIIERLLEQGDEEAITWLFKTYPKETIHEVLRITRRLSTRSANFWSLTLDLPLDEVLCLSPSFQKNHRAIWKH